MNSIIFDRIHTQQKNNSVKKEKEVVFTKYISPPISSNELQLELEKLFNIEQPINNISKNDIQDFPDLFHFVEWYLGKESLFSEKQNTALKTLVEAKNLINVGCACKRQQRLNAAQNYFQIFWTNNIKTDLLPKILSISQCKTIKFGNFLQFP